MLGWLKVALLVASIGTLVSLLIFVIHRICCPRKRKVLADAERAQSLQTGIAKLQHVNHHHHLDREGSKKPNYYVFRRGVPARPYFSWADHPSLVTDAVENGWSRFGFNAYSSSPSVRSARSLLGACGVGDQGREMEVEISWEVCQGSADFMQKIRFNSVSKNLSTSPHPFARAPSLIKTGLPLPGPPLGNSSFPQEAYFEIIIVSSSDGDENDFIKKEKKDKSEGEKAKLIQEKFNAKANSESLIHVTSGRYHGNHRVQESKGEGKGEAKKEGIMLTIGLTRGQSPSLPLKLPGSYQGSIGFNSDGSVYLDGIKLVFESEEREWGRADKVIGCGYNPSQKKVFFTVDSQLVHEVHCKSEEFGYPLYPTMAANSEVTVLVNLGQSAFRYGPANQQRTSNPCFIGPLANSPSLGYEEDSKELFSMGRIDSQWLNRSTTRSNNTTINSIKALDFDAESEGDLFEIVLDNFGKSPNVL